DADLDHVGVLDGGELRHAGVRGRRAFARAAVAGEEILVAARRDLIETVAEQDGLVADILEGLPVQDRSPGTLAGLRRIIGCLKRLRAAERGDDVVLDAVLAGRDQRRGADLDVVLQRLRAVRAADPAL